MNPKKSRYCPLPWNHLSVLGSGRIRLCCHDDQNIPYFKESGRSGFLRELKNPQDRLDHLDLIKVQTEIEREEIPPRCHHCFDLEKDGLDSPRLEYLERFGRDETNSLRYFDITLDNTCNLKCRMCTPKYSAGIAKDFEAIGIPLDFEDREAMNQEGAIFHPDLIKEVGKTVELVTITGGEPFHSPHLSNLLELLLKEGRGNEIELRFYTNATIFPEKHLTVLNQFKKVNVFLSLDGYGEVSDYIRYPSKWDHIDKIIKQWDLLSKENAKFRIHTHTVIQAYNILYIADLFKYLSQYEGRIPMIPSLTLIESPSLFKIDILPEKLLEKAKSRLNSFILENESKLNGPSKKVYESEIRKLYSFISNARLNNCEERFFEFIALSQKFDQLRGQDLKSILTF